LLLVVVGFESFFWFPLLYGNFADTAGAVSEGGVDPLFAYSPTPRNIISAVLRQAAENSI
jgi:hypothetical protein